MTDDELSAILKQWKVAPAPPGLEARVFTQRRRPGRSLWKWAASAAAAAIVVLLGVWRAVEVPTPQPGQPNAPAAKARPNQEAARTPVVSMPGQARSSGVPPVRIDAGTAARKLLQSPPVVYPEAARAAGIQGTVKLQIVIGKDGRVGEAMVISGNPLLAPAAIAAVNGRLYRSTLLNGQPVELVTEVEVNFKLP